MKSKMKVIQELKTGIQISDLKSNLKKFPHLRCNEVYDFSSLCSGQL